MTILPSLYDFIPVTITSLSSTSASHTSSKTNPKFQDDSDSSDTEEEEERKSDDDQEEEEEVKSDEDVNDGCVASTIEKDIDEDVQHVEDIPVVERSSVTTKSIGEDDHRGRL